MQSDGRWRRQRLHLKVKPDQCDQIGQILRSLGDYLGYFLFKYLVTLSRTQKWRPDLTSN